MYALATLDHAAPSRPGFTPPRSLLALAACALGASLLAAPAAQGKAYTLPELIELARKSNPGLAASAQATAKVEAQLLEAGRTWMPTGEFITMVAPVPDVRCQPFPLAPDGSPLIDPVRRTPVDPVRYCIHTNVSETSTSFSGVFTRTELRLVQPLFTFGKIAAGRQAAMRGLEASKAREVGQAADVELNVKKAYYGLKAARAALETLNEGLERVRRRPEADRRRPGQGHRQRHPDRQAAHADRARPRWTSACSRRRRWPTTPGPACARCSVRRRPPIWTSTTSRWTR